MNEESELTTFQSHRGSSNKNLTIVNDRLLKNLYVWEISADDSCSYHNIIKLKIGHETYYEVQCNHNGPRYIKNKLVRQKIEINSNNEVPKGKYRTLG
jgi:hypothetical protein